jgi:nifR3 family TIM-barrel protein
MAGISDLTFRVLARECGCALAFTEMVSANGLVRETCRTYGYLASSPQDRPLGVQLFGADPAILAEAARIAESCGADLIDINMGCPVKKVVKTGAGAALMRAPDLVRSVVAAVRRAITRPLTVKLRSGWRRSEVNAPQLALIAQEEGADAVVVHPRTADQGFGGDADWGVIGTIKAALTIPVIGSGDIRRPEDGPRMIQATRCDAVMIGRASLGNPWIFREMIPLLSCGDKGSPPTPEERQATILRHLNLTLAAAGEGPGIRQFRKHLLWYTRGMRGGGAWRRALGQIDRREDLVEAVRTLCNSPIDL